MGGYLRGGEMRVTLNRLGVPPCWRAYFLLLRQKKVAKEKATPGCAVGCANFPALLEGPGGCGTRGCAPQTVLAESPRPFSVARRSTRGPKGGVAEPESPRMVCYGQPGKKRKNEIATNSRVPALLLPLTRGRPGGGCLSGPLRGAEQRRNAGGSRLALSEPQASLTSRPAFRVAQGTGAAGTDPGVAFSLATFFWRSKRKYARPQGGTPSQSKPLSQEQRNHQC